jgi:PAS domain S-box-containing protein
MGTVTSLTPRLEPGAFAQALVDSPQVHDHIVQFYKDEDRLTHVVADFLVAGLRSGEPLVVIATQAHREAFHIELTVRGIDVEGAMAKGQLTLLDARATLDLFMVGEMPDWTAFQRIIGGTLETIAARGGHKRLRAYGEMVDLLWREGHRSAAVHLEGFWNELGKTHSFALLCAYVMGNFYKDTDTQQFEHVCRSHSHVLPDESYVDAQDPVERLRQVSLLQQRALALETELQDRKLLEQALRVALEDRSRAENQARQSKKELQDFVDNAAEGLHWVDADGRIIWANKAEYDLLGYSDHEYIGRHIAEFHADPEVIADILARLGRNETLQGYEARLKTKSGGIKHVLINSNVYSVDGKFIHSRCFTRDITDRKLAEDEARLRYEFEQQLIGIVSHDLRNPINAISMSAALARSRTSDERMSKTLARITSSAERVTRIISELLDLTQARLGGGIPIHPEDCDAHEIAQAVADEHGAAHPERELLVEHLGDGMGHWDRERVAQALANLVSNAIHYSSPSSPICLKSTGTRDHVILSVQNQGVPIPKQVQSNLFEPFKRSKGKRTSQSLGLGLFIVDRIVSAHGGNVECRSTETEGTTFQLRLPRLPSGVGKRDIEL